MKTVRVWLNHWFSTAWHIINLIKDDPDTNFVVIGSSPDPRRVYRQLCDEWYAEPVLDNSDAYVDFCLRFCREHHVDVFVPRRHLLAVGRRWDDFAAIGVKALVDRDYATLLALNNKAETYRRFTAAGLACVPPYELVYSLAEFERAYRQLKTDANRVCVKLATDEGAVSFRVIDDRVDATLTEAVGAKMTYASVVRALEKLAAKAAGATANPPGNNFAANAAAPARFPALLVMPYLSGVEVSVDCLALPDEMIIIPRFKSWGRSETIKYDPEIIAICRTFLRTFALRCPCNLQFKYEGDRPWLLEVNTRMSGGLQLTCAATGVNIPNLALKSLLGGAANAGDPASVVRPPRWERRTRVVSFVETPVILE